CLSSGALAVYGRHFGTQKGKSVSVRIDGQNVAVQSWADGQIEISTPFKRVDQNHWYHVEIFAGPSPVTGKAIRGCTSKPQLSAQPRGPAKPEVTAAPSQPDAGRRATPQPGLESLALPDLAVVLRIETNRPQAQITVRNASQTAVAGYTLDIFPAMDAWGRAPLKHRGPITGKTHGMLPAGGQRQHTAGLPDEGHYLCASVKIAGNDARPSDNLACAPLRQPVAQGGPPRALPANPGVGGPPTGIGGAIAKLPMRAAVPHTGPDSGAGPRALRPPNVEGAQPIRGHAPPSLGPAPPTAGEQALGRELDTTRPARPIRLNRLLVNGQAGRVDVRPGEPVTISWDIRDIGGYAVSGNPITGIYLGVSESPVPVGRGDARGNICVSNLPDEQQYSVSGFVSGGRQGTHRVTLAAHEFYPGTTYYLRGCATGGAEFTGGVGTNVVAIRYGWDADTALAYADLEVRDLNAQPAGGRGTGILAYRSEFTVRNLRAPIPVAESIRLGLADEFEVVVFVDGGANPSTVQRYPGAHQLLNGASQRLSIDYQVPDDGERHLVRVLVNSSHEIPERDFQNNFAAAAVFSTARGSGSENVDVRILDVEVVDQTPSSAWVRVRTDHAGFGERIEVWFSGPDTRVHCTSGQDDDNGTLDPARHGGGVMGEYRFLCGARGYSPSFSFETRQLTAEIRVGGLAHRVTRPFTKRWERSADTMALLPDLGFGEPGIRWRYTRAPRRENQCGSGGTITIQVTNTGRGPAPANRGLVRLLWNEPASYRPGGFCAPFTGAVSEAYEYWSGGFAIAPLAPGATQEIVVTVPAEELIYSANTTIEVVLDVQETVPETGADFAGYSIGTQTNVATTPVPRR
ncbi:MAG: hypothetical protein OEQ18_10665, partial [Gammaproteobacteria bacterium]|nr:hypothetical protein [Gammaproteobacteria bacterium]